MLRDVLLGIQKPLFQKIEPIQPFNKKLNASQIQAIEFALSAEDVAIIHGPPGTGKTLTVATIAPFFTRPSVVERLRGIEAALAGNGYNLVVFNVETAARRDACLRDVPRPDRCDGVLIISLVPRPDEVQR